ncbi:MAG: choice-of-anchor D domain-containing protein, partial [Candidatus Cloacimonetes bacterium]|nr:choice-of-anchor D domain-containing protein [Candidatus Cloacimonadota bacterium]
MKQKNLIIILFILSFLLTSTFANASTKMQNEDNKQIIMNNREWTILATYPIPEGASGLAYDGTYLYCGIYGANGDEFYRIDPDNGNYELLFTNPTIHDCYGMTFDGEYLWITDHGTGTAPADAIQLDFMGNILYQFALPTHYMSGIAYDNGDFWVAAYYDPEAVIYKVDTLGTIITQFDAPDDQPWDLCIEHGDLWMADYYGNALYKINASNGTLLETHASEHSNPAGIVFDGTYLWYCDNGEGYDQDWLYKIDLGGAGTPEIYVPITTHNYGTITVGDSSTWNATAQNIGTADLEITGISFTGIGSDYISCSLSFPQTIPVGNNLEIPLKYKPEESGELNCTATISSDDPLHPEVDITLTGNAVNPGPNIYVPVTSHNYGLVRINAITRWFMEIQNIGDALLVVDSIYCDDEHFFVDYDVDFPININVLGSEQIGIWFNPEEGIAYYGTLF